MLKSMTGFGRGEYEDEKFSATVEMKTVNHRYNEVAIRLPRFLNPLEDRIRKTILRSINRGRIDVFITADYVNDGLCTVKVDKPLAAAYHNALQEVAEAARHWRLQAGRAGRSIVPCALPGRYQR